MARRPAVGSQQDQRWMNATWMPHVSLLQTSHVLLSVRSAFFGTFGTDDVDSGESDARILVTVHGTADVSLLPVSVSTGMSALSKRSDSVPSGGAGADCGCSRPVSHDALRPCVANFRYSCEWNETVQVPLRWRDLPRDAHLRFRVVSVDQVVLYEASMSFFNEYGRLKTGLQKLDLHVVSPEQPQPEAVGAPTVDRPVPDEAWEATLILASIDRIRDTQAPAMSRSSIGHVPSVPWLDRFVADHCKEVLHSNAASITNNEHAVQPCLVVELPNFSVPVMHEETFYTLSGQGVSGNISPIEYRNGQSNALVQQAKSAGDQRIFSPLEMVPFLDYQDENVFEDKYRTLAHDLLRGMVDPALKPDRMQRDRLNAIIASPSHHPTREEKDLLWRFRFSLVDNRRALTKFLLAVDWTVEGEVVQAAELLEQWRMRSPIEVTDALKLLGKQVAYQTSLVRAYAIDTLATAPDEELRLYLLQLVQALKFENQQDGTIVPAGAAPGSPSSLGTFLINRASKNLQLANYLYWYLKVELQDAAHGARYREIFSQLQQTLSKTPYSTEPVQDRATAQEVEKPPHRGDIKGDSVKSSLKSIVSSVSKLGVTLVGAENHAGGKVTHRSSGHSSKLSMWDILTKQDEFISGIMEAQLESRDTRGKKDAKETRLKKLLADGKFDVDPKRQPIPLPSAPNLMINGVDSANAKMFKSALYPALLDFNVVSVSRSNVSSVVGRSDDMVADGGVNSKAIRSYKVIVKTGDDLRQDQLVIMMIQLMDGLLKRATLDLCLTPYSIIATSQTSGLVDFVNESIPVSAILSKHNGSILQFFRACAPQPGAKYDVRPDVMSSYIRSCAGYCVITYLLGVGDRHLDNILITTAGRFFHIDFGFMFGRDPKPLPPPFRLTREMVEGMGGIDSMEYRQFCSLSCQAFNALRKSAGLVLNLLHLMSDAGIEDLSNNPTADPDGVIAKVEERFRLDLTDEKAERFFLGLINDSLTAIAPRVMDVFHSIAVARR